MIICCLGALISLAAAQVVWVSETFDYAPGPLPAGHGNDAAFPFAQASGTARVVDASGAAFGTLRPASAARALQLEEPRDLLSLLLRPPGVATMLLPNASAIQARTSFWFACLFTGLKATTNGSGFKEPFFFFLFFFK